MLPPWSFMSFSTFGLSDEIVRAVTECGYIEPTPIQSQAIPAVLAGGDLLAGAQTGTGKTAGFTLPILHRLSEKSTKGTSGGRPPIRALILVPTRELAAQVEESVCSYGKYLKLSSMIMIGGVNINPQISRLRGRVDILVATPGRLLDHVQQKTLNLSQIEILVLDEADRMLDMGFITDVLAILQPIPKQRQTLLFSATISPSVNELAHKILNQHVEVRVAKQSMTADTVEHVMYPVEEKRKIELFMDLLDEHNWFQVLVFTSTKDQADQLMSILKLNKIDAAVCHADKSQGSRRRALADFKTAKIQVLIATEVAARGLDIEGLEYVVNYNLPYLAEDYVHRIGRTGRAGTKGHAISFVSREEERSLDLIEKLINSRVKRIHRPGFEVGDRKSLLKNLEETPRPGRTNKASRTKIIREKAKGSKRTNKKR